MAPRSPSEPSSPNAWKADPGRSIFLVRAIEELRDVTDPAWPVIEDAITEADEPAEVVPGDRVAGEETLLLLQVTARSFLGALALHTGGVLVDHGWLRILGGGQGPLNLCTANGFGRPPEERPGQVLVAFDVLGGRFAVNGGALPGSPGEVSYFAPDDLAWLPMDMKFSDFVLWSLTDRLAMFYEHLRWPGWEAEIASLALDQGLSSYPHPSLLRAATSPRCPADPSRSSSSCPTGKMRRSS
jgi:hypothetical protein